MLAGLLFLLLLSDGETSNCRYQDILNHLNLTKDNNLFFMTRPVNNHTKPTEVILDVVLYSILDVREKEQKLVSYVMTDMWWNNDFISWNPDDFCGIMNFTVPTEVLWKPDLTIEQMTEKDNSLLSPYIIIYHDGSAELLNDQIVVSICRLHVYRFPFDIQSCNLTFKSVVHTSEEIQLIAFLNSAQTQLDSKVAVFNDRAYQSQNEWMLIRMESISSSGEKFGFIQSELSYVITIKRRPALYIVNFMLPILFFLCLDFASFMISDTGGEKLSFKITVLLAVTVLQLILNEILPASSKKIPLIVIYCIGVFILMMLSLLETVLVMYLIKKDDEADEEQSLSEDHEDKQVSSQSCYRDNNTLVHCLSVCNVYPDETQSTPVTEESDRNQPMEESQDLKTLSNELKDAVKTLTKLFNDEKKKGRPGYWERLTKKINRVFFIFYVISASLFLGGLFFSWTNASEK